MNKVILSGTLVGSSYSHTIANTDYTKSSLVVKRLDGKNDVINLCYKTKDSRYKDGDCISIVGNIRSRSTRVGDKTSVEIYVSTHMDSPDVVSDSNIVDVDGRVCKIGKCDDGSIRFILANNIITNNTKINSYIPCVISGSTINAPKAVHISDELHLVGTLRSREYTKHLGNGEVEYRVAHELLISEVL